MSKKVKKVAFISPFTHPDVPQGHYRAIEDESDPHGGPLVVWIDGAPGDPEDPAGHFEIFEGDPKTYGVEPAAGSVPLEGATTGGSGTGIGGAS